jgi:hypothetical protein
MKFYVYFARGYFNEELVAECANEVAAMLRADEEFNSGSRDIAVYDELGEIVYTPTEEMIYDEY